MKVQSIGYWMLLGVLVATALIAAPVRAQDGDPDVETLMLRVLDGIQASEAFTSFLSTGIEQGLQSHSIRQYDTLNTFTTSKVVQVTTTYTQDTAGPNFQRVYNASFHDDYGDTVFNDTLYEYDAEVRVIGGMAYLTAAITPDSKYQLAGELNLPEDWVVLTNAYEWPDLSMLELADLLDNQDRPHIFTEDVALLLAHATEGSVESGALADGTPVDIITLRLTDDDLRLALRAMGYSPPVASGDVPLNILYDNLFFRASFWELSFQLDADGLIRIFDNMMSLRFDLSGYAPDTTADEIIDMHHEMRGHYTIDAINTPIDPIDVPMLD